MAKNKTLAALNEQIKYELASSYLYFSMAAYLDDQGLGGFAHWMRVQAREELAHVDKFYKFIIARGGQVTLGALEAPESSWKGVLDVMQAGLAHEQMVTGRINDLMDLAIKENDHASAVFLQWYVTEQVEEEENFRTIAEQLKMVKESPAAVFTLDNVMRGRS